MFDFGIGLPKSLVAEDATLSPTEILYAAVNGKMKSIVDQNEDQQSEKRLIILEETKSQEVTIEAASNNMDAIQRSLSEADNEVEDNEQDDELGQVSKQLMLLSIVSIVCTSAVETKQHMSEVGTLNNILNLQNIPV